MPRWRSGGAPSELAEMARFIQADAQRAARRSSLVGAEAKPLQTLRGFVDPQGFDGGFSQGPKSQRRPTAQKDNGGLRGFHHD